MENKTDAELLEFWRSRRGHRRGLDKDTASRLMCALVDEWMSKNPVRP